MVWVIGGLFPYNGSHQFGPNGKVAVLLKYFIINQLLKKDVLSNIGSVLAFWNNYQGLNRCRSVQPVSSCSRGPIACRTLPCYHLSIAFNEWLYQIAKWRLAHLIYNHAAAWNTRARSCNKIHIRAVVPMFHSQLKAKSRLAREKESDAHTRCASAETERERPISTRGFNFPRVCLAHPRKQQSFPFSRCCGDWFWLFAVPFARFEYCVYAHLHNEQQR